MSANLSVVALLLAVAAAAVVAAPGLPPLPPRTATTLGAIHSTQLEAEIEAWKKTGNPSRLQFEGDDGQPVWATVDMPAGSGASGLRAYGFDDDSDVVFHVYTKQVTEDRVQGTPLPLPLAKDSLVAAGWDASLPTKIVIHGFTNSIESPVIQNIKDAYLDSGAFNVIGVDWGVLCPAPLYVNARTNVPFVGRRVGALATLLVNESLATPEQLHLIGHSLGAHVAGLAAQNLDAALGVRPSRITGLDPAWPLFVLATESMRLSADDAELVDIIHTCAGFLGFPDSIGTSDFYPNGGRVQPGCGLDIAGMCAHSRSHGYFAESIKVGRGYQANYCDDFKDAELGTCTDQTDGCMGDQVEYKKPGSTYYLKTNADETPIQKC